MPKMADFGLAELTAYGDMDNHPGGFTSGTPGYYAPVRAPSVMWEAESTNVS